MRIAIVHPSLAVLGGAEYVVVWLAEELSTRGHAVTVITTEYNEQLYGSRSTKPYSVVTLNLGGYTIDPVRFLKAGWRLRRIIDSFDIVNPHNFPSYIWTYIAKVFNPRIGPIVWYCEAPERWFYPEVCNPHTLLLLRDMSPLAPHRPHWRHRIARLRQGAREWKKNVARAIDRRVVRRLDKVLTNSAFIAQQVQKIFQVQAVPCLLGIPLNRYPSHVNGKAKFSAPYVLTVSRLNLEKNIENILTAVRVLRDRGGLPFDRYIIVGNGPLKPTLQRKVRDLEIDDVVEFRGAISDAEVAQLYANAALVIYLPLDETFGLVYLEAALYRRAVIAPNHGGPTEIVTHMVTGLQVDPLNPTEIANAIERCLTDPSLLNRLGEAGHRALMSLFTFSHFVDRFEAALRQISPTAPKTAPIAPHRTVNSDQH